MDRWNALVLLVVGVILLAHLVPVFSIPPPPNCVLCPVEPQYGSLTCILLGHGGHYSGIPLSGHFSVSW